MSYSRRGAPYNRSRPSTLTGARAREGMTPGDLNERGFLSRFVGDLATIARNLPRALATMGGAVLSDAIAEPVRGIVPGGQPGFWQDPKTGDRRSAILEDLAKPIGESMLNTGRTVSTLGSSPLALLPGDAGQPHRERLSQVGQEFSEHPGLFAIEHAGNAALAGALISRPLGAAAQRAAGVTHRGMPRGTRGKQIAEIAESGGPGARLARASQISGDIVGRPYRTTLRGVADARLPSRLTRGEGPSANLREVAQQFRESAPMERQVWTQDMTQAAELRRLRGEVETFKTQADDLVQKGNLEAAEPLFARMHEARGSLESFQATQGPERIASLEQVRLTPTKPTSRAARRLRTAADTDLGQTLSERLGPMSRATRQMLTRLQEGQIEHTFDVMLARDPVARARRASRNLRLLDKEQPGLLKAHGIDLPPRSPRHPFGGVPDAELLTILEKVRDTPEVRSKLPNLDSTLDMTIIDTYERVRGLENGSLRNQLYDDATLTRPVAEALREAQRQGGEIPAVKEAVGAAYEIPAEHLATRLAEHPQVQKSYEGALNQLTREAAQRDLTLAQHGLGSPEHWAMRVEQIDGQWRALDPARNPELGISPSSAQARGLKRMGRRIQGLRSTREKLLRKAEEGAWRERGGVFDSYRSMDRQVKNLARDLEAANLPGEVAAPMLDSLNRVITEMGQEMATAGINLPEGLLGSQAKVQRAANLGEAGDLRAAVRESAPDARFRERLLRDQTRQEPRLRELDRSEKALQRAEAAFSAVEAEMRASIEAAPAVARPYLVVAQDIGPKLDRALRDNDLGPLADQLRLDGLAQTVDAMNEAGVSPTFLRRLENREGAVGYRAASEQTLATPRGAFSRRRSMSDLEQQRNIDRVKAQQDIELAAEIMARETATEFQTRFGRSADQIAESLIEDGRLNREAWLDMTKAQREKILQEAGWNVYAPDELFKFKVRRTDPAAGTPDAPSAWIPQHLNQALQMYHHEGAWARILKAGLEPGMQHWKMFVLALRPAWHVYNIVGNAAMATVAGGVNPGDFLRNIGEARRMVRQYQLGWDLQRHGLDKGAARELFGTGLSQDLAPRQARRTRISEGLVNQEGLKRLLDSPPGQRMGGASQKFYDLASASYRVNNYFDNLHRAIVYLDQVQVQGAPLDRALLMAKQTIGDYTKMNRVERQVLRNIFPFYAWMRHITQLTARSFLPDNITRASIFGTLVDSIGQPNETEALYPSYMAGDIQLANPGLALGVRGLNPFQDVFEPILYNDKLSLRGSMRMVNPLLQLGAERMSGIDTLTGRPFSRPVPVLDDLGRDIPTAPSLPRHLLTKLSPPQLQLLENIGYKARGETLARYSTGEPVLVEGAREPRLLAGLASFLGAPIRTPHTEGMGDRRQQIIDRQARLIERYEGGLEEYQTQRRRRSLPRRLMGVGS